VRAQRDRLLQLPGSPLSQVPRHGGARLAGVRQADLLEVEYFHVVFTLPQQIAAVAYQNKAVVYGILFEASVETLKTIASDPKQLGAEIGLTAVLHTWGQTLTHHPHVHCIVPGGGLSPCASGSQARRRGYGAPAISSRLSTSQSGRHSRRHGRIFVLRRLCQKEPIMMTSKIAEQHLSRAACVYIRQSTGIGSLQPGEHRAPVQSGEQNTVSWLGPRADPDPRSPLRGAATLVGDPVGESPAGGNCQVATVGMLGGIVETSGELNPGPRHDPTRLPRENPPYGILGGTMETSASFEARSAPSSYPTHRPTRPTILPDCGRRGVIPVPTAICFRKTQINRRTQNLRSGNHSASSAFGPM
jgi:hypothetical protein